MNGSALQPVATILAAVIAVSVPLMFSFLGNRSSRRRTAELELLTKLSNLRPGLGDEQSRAKIDTLTADYLDDIQIGLRDEARSSGRLILVMLLAWAAGLTLQAISLLVTNDDLDRLFNQVLWGVYASQLLAAIAVVIAALTAWKRFRGWRRIGRQGKRRAKRLEEQAEIRQVRVRGQLQALRGEQLALTADQARNTKLVEEVKGQTNALTALQEEVARGTTTAKDLLKDSEGLVDRARSQTERLTRLAADSEGSEDDAPV